MKVNVKIEKSQIGFNFVSHSYQLSNEFIQVIIGVLEKIDSQERKRKIVFECQNEKASFSEECTIIIASVLYRLLLEGRKVYTTKNFSDAILNKLSFYSFLSKNMKVFNTGSSSKFKGPIKFGYIDYSKFDKDFIKQLCRDILNKALNLSFHKIPDEVMTPISETFFNAYEHSNGSYHFFSSHTKEINDEQYICYNVIDFGVSIPKKIKSHFRELFDEGIDSLDAVDWAVKPGNTTKLYKAGGNGFSALFDIINKYSGTLRIISGDVNMRFKNKYKQEKLNKFDFPGAIITIELKVQKDYQVSKQKKELLAIANLIEEDANA